VCVAVVVQCDFFFPVRVALGVLQGDLQWVCFCGVALRVRFVFRCMFQCVLQWACCSGCVAAVLQEDIYIYIYVYGGREGRECA